jgi:DNA-binding transcriptional LysR family regulator
VLLESELTQAGVGSPEDVVECSSIFATLQLLQSGNAIAILPESVARDHVKAALLKTLPITLTEELTPFGILTRKNEALSDVAAVFVARLHTLTLERVTLQRCKTTGRERNADVVPNETQFGTYDA